MTSLHFEMNMSSKFRSMFSNEDAKTCQKPQVNPLCKGMITAHTVF